MNITPLIRRLAALEETVGRMKTKENGFSRIRKSLTLATDAVTVDHHDHFTLQPQTGTSDDLATISGGADGRRITLYPEDSGDTITVKNNTGNILLGADRVLDNQADTLTLIYSAALSKWIELSYHDTASGTASTEAAQDAVGTILLDSSTIDFTYDDAAPSITGIVIDDSITNAKLANMAQTTVKGRAAGAGTGDPTDLSASQLLTIILTVDGAGSGLDADLLDGLSSAAFATAVHVHAGEDITSGTVADARIASTITRDSEVFGIVLAADGSGSGLDADLLDGQSGAYYLDRTNHISTQLASTISDFAEAVDDRVGTLIIDSSTIDATYNDGAGTLSLAVIPGGIDHGALGGLTDDDHTGYARLTGRAGSQVLQGGTAANEDLTLEGTAHATKTTSYVILQPTSGNVGIGVTSPVDKLSVTGGGLFLLNATNDFTAIRMRPNDGNFTTRVQGVGDGNVAHSGIAFVQTLPTGAGTPTDGNLHLQTMDAGSLATRVWILDSGHVGIGGSPATRLNVIGTSAILRFGTAGEADSSVFTIDIATSGGSTNSGNGRTLLIKAADSDNTAGKSGGTLYLRPGEPVAPATAYGNLVIADLGGNVLIADDTDRPVNIGRARVGYGAISDFAWFSHRDRTAVGEYAVIQDTNGQTYVNSASGQPLNFRIANNDKMIMDSSGQFGIGLTAPQGKFHGHDGTGGFGFFSKTAINGSAQTIIPDAAGDVTKRGYILYMVTTSGGASQSGALPLNVGSDAEIYNDGTNTDILKFRINANGSVDVRRTAGALTYSASVWFVWQ